jgi:hypothetical protein
LTMSTSLFTGTSLCIALDAWRLSRKSSSGGLQVARWMTLAIHQYE